MVATLLSVAFAERKRGQLRRALAWDVLTAISLSSFGKLFALVTLVWGGERHWHIHLAVSVFIMASNVVGVKVALGACQWRVAAMAVAAAGVARELVAVGLVTVLPGG